MPDPTRKDTNNSAIPDRDEEALKIPPNRPLIPHLRSDSQAGPHSLEAFRELEGREYRKQRLIQLWKSLPQVLQSPRKAPDSQNNSQLTSEKAQSLKAMYDNELLDHCAPPSSSSRPSHIGWREFKNYSEAKEAGGYWSFFKKQTRL